MKREIILVFLLFIAAVVSQPEFKYRYEVMKVKKIDKEDDHDPSNDFDKICTMPPADLKSICRSATKKVNEEFRTEDFRISLGGEVTFTESYKITKSFCRNKVVSACKCHVNPPIYLLDAPRNSKKITLIVATPEKGGWFGSLRRSKSKKAKNHQQGVTRKPSDVTPVYVGEPIFDESDHESYSLDSQEGRVHQKDNSSGMRSASNFSSAQNDDKLKANERTMSYNKSAEITPAFDDGSRKIAGARGNSSADHEKPPPSYDNEHEGTGGSLGHYDVPTTEPREAKPEILDPKPVFDQDDSAGSAEFIESIILFDQDNQRGGDSGGEVNQRGGDSGREVQRQPVDFTWDGNDRSNRDNNRQQPGFAWDGNSYFDRDKNQRKTDFAWDGSGGFDRDNNHQTDFTFDGSGRFDDEKIFIP